MNRPQSHDGTCRRLRHLIVGYIVALGVTSSVSAVPFLLNYQGLMDTSDSLAIITFRIHDSSTTVEALWSEAREVRAVDGRFDLLLGSLTPLEPALFNGSERYLSLTVGGDEMSPRQQIVSVAYALRAAQAADVSGETIHPASVVLQDTDASWDATGVLKTASIETDSLVIGSTPVIDGNGNWIGPSITQQQALTLRSITQTVVDESFVFFFNSRWLSLDGLDTFIDIPAAGTLDIAFAGQISFKNAFQTRLTLKRVSPTSEILGQVGNVSGSSLSESVEGSTVFNQAIVEVEPGNYRLIVEHQSTSVVEGTFRNSSLIIRYYE